MRAAKWMRIIFLTIFACVILAGLANAGQQANAIAAAPIPQQIAAAHKIFIANGGDICVDAQKLGGAPNHAYNLLYAGLKSDGHYELVATPEQADLVFEVTFVCPLVGLRTDGTWDNELRVEIIDPQVRLTIWTFSEPVEKAFLTSTANKNLAAASKVLVSDLTELASPSATASH